MISHSPHSRYHETRLLLASTSLEVHFGYLDLSPENPDAGCLIVTDDWVITSFQFSTIALKPITRKHKHQDK